MTACIPSQLCPVYAKRQAYIMNNTHRGPNSIHALLHFDKVALAPKPDRPLGIRNQDPNIARQHPRALLFHMQSRECINSLLKKGDFPLQTAVENEQSWLPRWPRPLWCNYGQHSAALANRLPVFYDRATRMHNSSETHRGVSEPVPDYTRLLKGCIRCQLRCLSSLGKCVAESSRNLRASRM